MSHNCQLLFNYVSSRFLLNLLLHCACLHYVVYVVLFDVKLFINMLILVELKNGCCADLCVVHTDHCYVLFRWCI